MKQRAKKLLIALTREEDLFAARLARIFVDQIMDNRKVKNHENREEKIDIYSQIRYN
ncbi:MAG: hypothetical protein WCG99_03485 [Candidatus Berkelbacteria bacterium]